MYFRETAQNVIVNAPATASTTSNNIGGSYTTGAITFDIFTNVQQGIGSLINGASMGTPTSVASLYNFATPTLLLGQRA